MKTLDSNKIIDHLNNTLAEVEKECNEAQAEFQKSLTKRQIALRDKFKVLSKERRTLHNMLLSAQKD